MFRGLKMGAAVVLAGWLACAGAQGREAASLDLAALTPEQRRALPLSEKLRLARPADPMQQGGRVLPALPSRTNRWVARSADGVERDIDSAPEASTDGLPLHAPDWPGPLGVAAGDGPEAGIGLPEVSRAPTATMPTPLLDTFSFPFRTIGKMLMGFDGIYYVCSATVVNRYFLFTAGHCVYNHDPNGDGNNADRQWADELWFFPGQTDQLAPTGEVEYPYGEATWLEVYAYSGWTVNGDVTYDQAFVRLDRSVGDTTGWTGYETNVPVGGLNFSGYPAETPYVPFGNLVQYFGFESNNVIGYSAQRIELAAHIWGGHSGGPVWRYDGSSHRLQGMNSTSDRAGSAAAARITNQVFNDLQAEIAEPRTEVLRPDLAEWTRWTQYPTKRLLSSFARPGEAVSFEYNVGNLGHTPSGEIAVDFYLVYGTWQWPEQGIWIGSTTMPGLLANTWYLPQQGIVLPSQLGAGSYYVAWRITGAEQEYVSNTSTYCAPWCNNNAYIDTSALRVAGSWQWPDLRPTAFTASTQYIFRGEQITLAAEVINEGNFPARGFWAGFYLSADSQCDVAQDVLLGFRSIATLAEAASGTAAATVVTIPADWPIGTAKLCVFADDLFSVAESDETDNARMLPVYIDGLPDAILADGFEALVH